MSSKTKTTQNQTQSGTSNFNSTYGYMAPPDSADTAALRDFKFEPDPRIPYSFARAAGRMKDTYSNPLGGYTTPQLRDATLRAGSEDLGQEEAQAQREDHYNMQGLELAKRTTVAGMTAPRLVQTGGSGTSSGNTSGTATQSQSPGIDPFIQGASSIGSALLL